jgi:biotin synthase
MTAQSTPSTPWSIATIDALFELPFADLLYRAQGVHRAHFDAQTIQRSSLLSVKTGGCSEDCKYCSQSARHEAKLARESMLRLDQVIAAAQSAKAQGATRFCMGAAWRGPKDRDLAAVLDMVRAVKALGLETCATLGLLKPGQAEQLAQAGLDYYNHNLDTAEDFYGTIVSTHSYEQRLDTLNKVRAAGMKICCGGIIGMGEARHVRAGLLAQLAQMNPPPESVPINHLVAIPGTPLADTPPLDVFEFVRTIAVARIIMPTSYIRLSAGRSALSDEAQALCFLAGANSVFYGERLLTTGNADCDRDDALFNRLGLRALALSACTPT